jgi:cellobiose phosphorylase
VAEDGPTAGAAPATGTPSLLTVRTGTDLRIDLLENGSIFAIRHGDILVNQVLGSPLEGGPGGLFLRRRAGDGVAWAPLIGPASASTFRWSLAGADWTGGWHGIAYRCSLRLASSEPTWSWGIELTNATPDDVALDIVLAQDLGLASEAVVRSSERYTSQYLDHTPLDDPELGVVLATRQNQAQDGRYPWLIQACLDGAAGYLTDGVQFYGLDYRATNQPAVLSRPALPNRREQGEFALPTLQSRTLVLAPGAQGALTFVAAFRADHPEASGPADLALAHEARSTMATVDRTAIEAAPIPRSPGLFDAPRLFPSDDLGAAELARHFGAPTGWRHIEREGATIRSFFHGAGRHVVLRAKELVSERPTGDILRSGRDLLPTEDTLAVTAWMAGVFGSHLVIGNTTYDKLLSVCRDPLNVRKSSGQRIFVRRDQGDELLGMPSAFESGPLFARWIYHDQRSTIVVRLSTSLDDPVCHLDVEVVRGDPAALVVVEGVVLGADEYDPLGEVDIDREQARIRLRPHPDSFLARHYPEASFAIAACDPAQVAAIGRDGLLRANGDDLGGTHIVVVTHATTRFSMVLAGSLLDADRAAAIADRAGGADTPDRATVGDTAATRAGAAWRSEVARGATLGGASGATANDIARLDELIGWYLHDGLIHATSPHGLEQSTGAAWAVRDVCQGPVEMLVALGRPEPIREILRVVYEHQFEQTGDWPQWFMFDRYRSVQAADSHADIILWPLKALCDYVEATDDLSILDERVAWTDQETLELTQATASIFDHTVRQIQRIEDDTIPGTALSVFAGGDWEDTLQPVDPAMAKGLVSAWTVELAFQTLERYRVVCERAGRSRTAARLSVLTARIRVDFQRHLVPDGVVTGLAHFGPDGIDYLLHPRDERTGVAYRLLPMTRGITSAIFEPDQARAHVDLIDEHLSFPDGVRLMDQPMPYRGGVSTLFKRAESAAYFGREVGLQYVHAHIRYVEAMCRMGRAEEAFRGLLAVCPIGLHQTVTNALPRQANAYFSSSDADFADRGQASLEFDRVRTGEVGVKGGWRVYSSGPGIYLNQLISNVLGLRRHFDDVVIDPILPRRADGLTFEREEGGRRVRYRFDVSGDGLAPSDIRVNGASLEGGRRVEQPYRAGGLAFPHATWVAALDRDVNVVEVQI